MATNKKPRKKYNTRPDQNKPVSKKRLNTAILPMERFYQQIVGDCVSTVGANVVFLDWEGVYCEVKSAMEGWCGAFERLSRDIGGELKLLAIRKMGVWLSAGIPIPDDLIKKFREELNQCIALYASVPAYQIVRSMKTEQVSIEFDSLGITNA